ncbi:hypothetical protein AVO45_12610 [Ruegeria marisrubri]|uniref:Regulatory protein SoxS n=1 Tax=Ruegeria marisrubri TaxID=1685379 RepID=A0A0X3TK68_9RHOB|nr:hypothetical protein [Ruegeria marisrubri]KUJ76153.1 hypothetical protein AVO45_12610 [Ruegeria marisrubri]
MFRFFIVLVLSVLALTPARAAELVMVEEAGCAWCERWNAEIAPAYPKTAEGRFAPLRRVSRHDIPHDLKLQRPVHFTPTFIVVESGEELARLEGYPGENFFWPLLERLLTTHTNYGAQKTEES